MVRRTTTATELLKVVQQDRYALRKIHIRSQIKQAIVSLLSDGLYHHL
jgi:hypothetical protein